MAPRLELYVEEQGEHLNSWHVNVGDYLTKVVDFVKECIEIE